MKETATAAKSLVESERATLMRISDDSIESLVREYVEAVGELPEAPTSSADLIQSIKKFAAVSRKPKRVG